MSNDLATALEQAGETPQGRSVRDLIYSMEPELQRSLQSEGAAQMLLRHYFNAIRFNELLRQCSAESLAGALLLSAQVRLEPGPLGHVYLVPFKVKGAFQVVWMLGYTGIIELGRRGGAKGLRATVVWSDDEWTGIKNVSGRLRYELTPNPERAEDAERIGVLVEWQDGVQQASWCPPSRVDAALKASALGDNGRRDTDWYWRKTGVRFVRPWLPLTTELAQASQADDAVVADVDVVDGTAQPTLTETVAETDA
jgi:recombination protein RecT